MRTLDYTKKHSFKNMGEQWKDCYVSYRPFSFEMIEEISKLEENTKSVDILLNKLADRFVEGRVVVNGQVVDMEADDLKALPIEEMNALFKEATGFLAQESEEK